MTGWQALQDAKCTSETRLIKPTPCPLLLLAEWLCTAFCGVTASLIPTTEPDCLNLVQVFVHNIVMQEYPGTLITLNRQAILYF